MSDSNQPAWVVLKFGGSSVATVENWNKITQIINNARSDRHRVLIVCSAPANVSNLLETLLQEARQGDHASTLQTIEAIYIDLARDMKVDVTPEMQHSLTTLKELAQGISLLHEVSHHIHAQVLSFGELLLTQLASAYLQKQSIENDWIDAREYLKSEDQLPQDYLSATCASEKSDTLIDRFNDYKSDILVTQGFIASNQKGETVLLGRGGSDTSAALFASKLGAQRCEIWTDVPGIYTANPRDIPQARLLKALDYNEAQEIAATGGKVLHPGCLSPLRRAEIPLYIKYTQDPDREGTLVSRDGEFLDVQIKSILTKKGLTLITIETVRMWQEVGFLANVFDCFKRHGLSVDLLSSSQSSVTISLDNGNLHVDPEVLQDLLKELNSFARAKTIGPCASISLVGNNIGATLHKLGDVFELFESQRIYLLSQSANDLNLTFVVDEDQALRIAKKLHNLLIDQNPKSFYLSKSWQEEFGELPVRETPWWAEQQSKLLRLAEKKSPVYLYSGKILEDAAQQLLSCDAVDKVFYAMKANSNPDILKLFYRLGLNLECVSIAEVALVLDLFPDIDRKRILFTPNFAPRAEYEEALNLGLHVTLDSLFPLRHWPEVFSDHEIIVRVDPGQGAGHHKYVHTAGAESKFGVLISQLDEFAERARKHNIKVFGLHAHVGSGILTADNWQGIAIRLTSLLDQFPDVRVINVGGGLGVIQHAGQSALDMKEVDRSLAEVKASHFNLELWMEPGRFLVSNAGVLLARVTQVKQKGDMRFVGIETGMNSLIRPALYGAYHEIVNLSRVHDPHTQMVNIVGPICESGDTLGYARLFPETEEGDVILIANVGAYGSVMSSHYNSREPAEELYLA